MTSWWHLDDILITSWWHDDMMTSWWRDDMMTPGDQVTGWPSDQVTKWQSDRVTGWQEASQTIDWMVYLLFLSPRRSRVRVWFFILNIYFPRQYDITLYFPGGFFSINIERFQVMNKYFLTKFNNKFHLRLTVSLHSLDLSSCSWEEE